MIICLGVGHRNFLEKLPHSNENNCAKSRTAPIFLAHQSQPIWYQVTGSET